MLPFDDKLKISEFSQVLDSNLLTNSYKLLWLDVIFSEVLLGRNELYFKDIVIGMVKRAWYPVIKFKLSFGIQDQITVLVNYIENMFFFLISDKDFDLETFLLNSDDNYIKSSLKNLEKYVPYRLLSPFVEGLQCKKDAQKNAIIIEASQKSKEILYKIDEINKKIILNENWARYFIKNQVFIKAWLDYNFIQYLQKKNPSVPAISLKIKEPLKRELLEKTKIWKTILSEVPFNDIYTGNLLEVNNLSLDHFIPWSFVLHDENWNLIPTTKNMNSSKNDRLPNLDKYLERFIDSQYRALETMYKKKMYKVLEEYSTVYPLIDVRNLMIKEIFFKQLKNVIFPLHQTALNQGFAIWEK